MWRSTARAAATPRMRMPFKRRGACDARGLQRLFIDTSPRPSAAAAEVAAAMHAEYLPLPFADARALSSVVSAATTRVER